MLQRDYLMRVIEQAMRAIARALGLRREGEHQRALAALGQAYEAVLPFDPGLLGRLDAATLAAMIGAEPLVRMVARLSKLEGELLEEQGERAAALRCFQRALELYAAVGVGDGSEDRFAADELAARFRRPS